MSTVHAWTNTRQAPSDADQRSSKDIREIANLLDLPLCDRDLLVTKIKAGYGHRFTMTHNGGNAFYRDGDMVSVKYFSPIFKMSGRRDGVDFVTEARAEKGIVASGLFFEHTCNGITHDVGIFPSIERDGMQCSCGNMVELFEMDRPFSFWDRYEYRGEVSSPGVATLLIIGIGAFLLIKRIRRNQ